MRDLGHSGMIHNDEELAVHLPAWPSLYIPCLVPIEETLYHTWPGAYSSIRPPPTGGVDGVRVGGSRYDGRDGVWRRARFGPTWLGEKRYMDTLRRVFAVLCLVVLSCSCLECLGR